MKNAGTEDEHGEIDLSCVPLTVPLTKGWTPFILLHFVPPLFSPLVVKVTVKEDNLC